MPLKNTFQKRAFKRAAGAVLMLTSTQAQANEQDMSFTDNVVASAQETWQNMVGQSPEEPRVERGPIPRDTFNFDPEKDVITLQAGPHNREYIQKVEQAANDYIQQGVDPHLVVTALKVAQEVDVDFLYLMKTIEIECTFDFSRSPSTSSAQGPGLLNGAWKDLARKHGEEWGFTEATDRRDHYWGSLGAALYIKDSISYIRSYYREGDLEPEMIRGSYFFGDGGNRTMLTALQDRPSVRARDVFPRAARANPTIFRNRSIQAVYRIVGQKVEDLKEFVENPPSFNFSFGVPQPRPAPRINIQSIDFSMPGVEEIANLLPDSMRLTQTEPPPRQQRQRQPTGRIEF